MFKGFKVWIEVEEIDEPKDDWEPPERCGGGAGEAWGGAEGVGGELESSVELLAEMTRAVEVFCAAVDMIQGVEVIAPAALQKSTYVVGLRQALAKVKGGGQDESDGSEG